MSYIAIDTETLGLDEDDLPFAVSTTDDQGNSCFWQWEVNPKTRVPKIPKKDKQEIIDEIRGKQKVFWNYAFDIGKLEKVGIRIKWRDCCHDTSISSHVVNSRIHRRYDGKLNNVARHYLTSIQNTGTLLRDAVKSSRFIAQRLGWNIAVKGEGRGKDHVARDYWLPRQIGRSYLEDCQRIPPKSRKRVLREKYGGKLDKDLATKWLNILEHYALNDTEETITLFLSFQKIIEERGLIHVYERERKLVLAILDFSRQGVHLRVKQLSKERKRFTKIQKGLLRELCTWAGSKDFNPNSPIQRTEFFDRNKIKGEKRTPTGYWSTTKDDLKKTLERYANLPQAKPLECLSRFRACSKAVEYTTTYEKFREGTKLKFSLNQVGTSTTRLSSKDPNSTQIGKGKEFENEDGETYVDFSLRSIFGPSKGRVWYPIDYSQLQLRIFAYVSKEVSLIRAFQDGWDAHDYTTFRIQQQLGNATTRESFTASKQQRTIGKNTNFGFIFGAQKKKINSTSGVDGLYDMLKEMFPNAIQFIDEIGKQVTRKTYVTTPFGYRLYIPYENGKIKRHAGVNYIVQGTEGDIVKNATIKIHEYLRGLQKKGFSGKMILLVHDEIVFDFPLEAKEPKFKHKTILKKIKGLMEGAGTELGMVTPVDVGMCTESWDKEEKYVI
jgi:DNA polymerase-1